jgi:hypothetical protein
LLGFCPDFGPDSGMDLVLIHACFILCGRPFYQCAINVWILFLNVFRYMKKSMQESMQESMQQKNIIFSVVKQPQF